jgi:hypothetical protein
MTALDATGVVSILLKSRAAQPAVPYHWGGMDEGGRCGTVELTGNVPDLNGRLSDLI